MPAAWCITSDEILILKLKYNLFKNRDFIEIRVTARVTPVFTVTLYDQRNVLKQHRQVIW